MTDRSPSLAELIRLALEHRLSSLHVCLPGVIVSYDATKQIADVKAGLRNTLVTSDGEETFDYPVIPNVPVAHPRAGDWFVHYPLVAGDSVLLVFSERALDKWRLLGDVQNAEDLRKHDISDAIAIPANLYPDAKALTGLSAAHLTIGKQGGATIHVKEDGKVTIEGASAVNVVTTGAVNLGSAVPADSAATALKTNAELSALNAVFAAWVPVPGDGGAVLKTALTALQATGWPHDVASTKVKVDP